MTKVLSYLFSSVLMLSSCTGGNRKAEESTGDDASSAVAQNDSTQTYEINSFNGSATPEELNVLLSNSDLQCTTGQFLQFDGSNWVCGSAMQTEEVSLKFTGQSDLCDASNENGMRYNQSSDRFEICGQLTSGGNFQWMNVPGVINQSTTISIAAGDCAGLISTVRRLKDYKIDTDANVAIQLADGTYNCADPIVFYHFSPGYVQILGNITTPGNVVLRFTDTHGIIADHGSMIRFINGIRIEAVGTGDYVYGIVAHNNSTINLGPKIEIDGFNTTGSNSIRAAIGSHVAFNSCTVTDHPVVTDSLIGIAAERGSTVHAPYIDITGVGSGNAGSRGVIISQSSFANVSFGEFDAVYRGVEALGKSEIDAANSTSDGAHQAYVSHYGGVVNAYQAQATNCIRCFETNLFGVMNATLAQATCNATGGDVGFAAHNGANMYADLSVVNGGNCSTINYQTANGGTIIDP